MTRELNVCVHNVLEMAPRPSPKAPVKTSASPGKKPTSVKAAADLAGTWEEGVASCAAIMSLHPRTFKGQSPPPQK